MSYDDIATRWADQVGKPDAKLLRSQSGNVFVHPYNDRELVSYGTHFTLARIMPDTEGNPRGWWLLNGDNYSVSTSRHQSTVRGAVQRTGLPVLIVPFTVLNRASIDPESIVPVDITADRYEPETHVVATRGDLPEYMRGNPGYWDVRERDDGRLEYDTQRHWLGASVFRATYSESYGDPDHTAYFLSAFDEQETRPLYFLAQLPDGAGPQAAGNMQDGFYTVADALMALRPPEVIDAMADDDYAVTRQGDVFAIPVEKTTRELRANGAYPIAKQAYVLEVNHTASEVIVTPEGTYGRGVLRHAPQGFWRAPEHKRQKMGDGKTWHLLVKNTVPEGRSWSMGGNVD
jgi:hypothetical protein